MRFVRLRVSEDGQDRRIDAANRAAFNRPRSLDTLKAIRAMTWVDPAPPPVEPELDTETLEPDVAAERIMTAFGLVPLARPHEAFDG